MTYRPFARGFNKWRGAASYPKRFSKPFNGNGSVDAAQFVKKATGQTHGLTEPETCVPSHAFTDFDVHPQIQKNIVHRGYKEPTPIQDQVIPHVLAGKDVIGIANTGTGKTAAFVIPLIDKVMRNRAEKVFIVTPTRELALQIQDEFKSFAHFTRLHSVLCIGGANINPQIEALRKHPHFVIGTPGRLKDLIERRVLHLSGFKNIVLDEVDRMVDMGFIEDVRFLVAQMPRDRQSLFFSATVPNDIEPVVKSFLRDPVTVSVKKRETCANVEQDVIRVKHGSEKLAHLQNMLGQHEFKKVLIFARTKRGAEKLSILLCAKGFRAVSIHGDKSQAKRQQALNQFKYNHISILVATDVASRGLDIDDVTHVINFDQPDTYENYVHRIGRTGRMNKKGTALTFVEDSAY